MLIPEYGAVIFAEQSCSRLEMVSDCDLVPASKADWVRGDTFLSRLFATATNRLYLVTLHMASAASQAESELAVSSLVWHTIGTVGVEAYHPLRPLFGLPCLW
jgi:hypothetical protein